MSDSKSAPGFFSSPQRSLLRLPGLTAPSFLTGSSRYLTKEAFVCLTDTAVTPAKKNLLVSTLRGALIATQFAVVTVISRASSVRTAALPMAEAEDLALAAEPGRLALEAQADAHK